MTTDDRLVEDAPAEASVAVQHSVLGRARDAAVRVAEWRPDRVEGAVLAITLLALALRITGLDVRALHHDESLHATFSWYLAEGRGYRHDPLTHGPFQFHITALSFLLFGDSDATSRVPAALFGTALVLTPLLLRRTLGSVGTVTASALFTISPALLYYSRFAREDSYVALFLMLASVAVWRYLQDGRLRWLLALSASLAFAFSTKETTYIYVAMLLLYLNGATAHRIFWQAHEGREVSRGQLLRGLLLIPVTWVVVAFWEPLTRVRGRSGWERLPREGDLLIVVGTLTLPLLAALAKLPVEALNDGPLSGDLDRRMRIATVGGLLIATAWVGTGWRPAWWLAVAGTFLAVTVPLFTTGFTQPERIWGLPWDSLSYWLDQHGVQRGGQPPFYYLMMLPIYEILALVPALVGAAWFIARRDGFAIFVGWWFLGSLVALSYAGEKMPWLTVHLAIPLALLAAYSLARAIPAAMAAVREARWRPAAAAGSALAGAIMLLLLVYTLDTDIGLNHGHPDTPVEPLIYVQTTPEVPVLSREIRRRLVDGRAGQVLVDNSESLTWPWAWYLRDLDVRYADAPFFRERATDPDTILLLAVGTLRPDSAARDQFEPAVEYLHRWWFLEDGYRRTTWRSFSSGLADGSLIRKWGEFVRHRTSPETLGALEGEVLFPRRAAPVPAP